LSSDKTEKADEADDPLDPSFPSNPKTTLPFTTDLLRFIKIQNVPASNPDYAIGRTAWTILATRYTIAGAFSGMTFTSD
jgi:hypothetical protein